MSASLSQALGPALLTLIPLILSLTVHEFAHAGAAFGLGDDTAQRAGRLTLSPLAHIDPVGTVALPLVIMVAGNLSPQGMLPLIPLIGWARPTPVNAGRFRRSVNLRRGILWVAAAGPLANVVVAWVAAAALVWGPKVGIISPVGPFAQFANMMLTLNIGLAVFNLLPISPLDGQKVVANLLSPGQQLAFERFSQRFGLLMLLMLIWFFRQPLGAVVMGCRRAVLVAAGL